MTAGGAGPFSGQPRVWPKPKTKFPCPTPLPLHTFRAADRSGLRLVRIPENKTIMEKILNAVGKRKPLSQ